MRRFGHLLLLLIYVIGGIGVPAMHRHEDCGCSPPVAESAEYPGCGDREGECTVTAVLSSSDRRRLACRCEHDVTKCARDRFSDRPTATSASSGDVAKTQRHANTNRSVPPAGWHDAGHLAGDHSLCAICVAGSQVATSVVEKPSLNRRSMVIAAIAIEVRRAIDQRDTLWCVRGPPAAA